MIPECVVLASCLMLTAAQLQLPFQQIPNIPQIGIPTLSNSQLVMTQSANSLLNQETPLNLNPGILGGIPVFVSDATQSILDQESKIIGYNLPRGLQPGVQQQFRQFGPRPRFPSPPRFAQFTRNNAIFVNGNAAKAGRSFLRRQPKFVSLPLLNNVIRQQRPFNVVPVRSGVSLNSFQSARNPSVSFNPKPVHQQTTNPRQHVYYDIPPNHPLPPVPPPTSFTHPPPSRNSNSNQQGQHVHVPPAVRQPAPYRSPDEDVVGMRPPPQSHYLEFYRQDDEVNARPDKPQRTQTEESRNRENARPSHVPPPAPSSASRGEKENDKSQKRKKSKDRSSKSKSSATERRTTRNSATKHSSAQDSTRSRSKSKSKRHDHFDSETEASEDNFSTILLRPPPPPNQPSSYNSYDSNDNNDNAGTGYGYSSNDNDAIVHKHIFVHAAPETYSQGPRVRVIRPPVKPEKHVQIIFVKSPTEAPPTQTIVELPPAEQPKTLVYVLSKKPDETGGSVKVVKPTPSKPHAPEIYFIRYGDNRKNQGYPVPDLQSLNLNENNSGYNAANSQPLPIGDKGSYNQDLLSFLRQKRNKDYGLDVYAPLMAYSSTGQINEITRDEADLRKSSLDGFF